MSIRYVGGKLATAVGTLFFVLIFNFFLFHAIGDPAKQLIRSRLSAAQRIKEIHQLGLDQSQWVQFKNYITNTLQLNLGYSQISERRVSAVIWQALPNTIILAGFATILATLVGSWLGAAAAARRGSSADTGITQSSLLFYATPDFFLGMMMIWLFAVVIKAFPTGGKSDPGASFSTLGYVWNVAQHGTLPILTLALGLYGQYVLIMRSALADVLSEDFITTARAIGLPRHRVLYRHGVRNASLPVVTFASLNLGLVLSGALVIEALFSWPGLGLLSYQAIVEYDFPVLQGVFLVASAAVILANLVSDFLYPILDPRVRAV